MTDSMTVQFRVDAPVKEVHRALTDPDALRTWLAEHASVEPPHRFEFWGRHTPEGDAPHQRLLHLDDRTLRFSWLLDGVETTAEFRLEESGEDATAITLTQTHFDFEDSTSVRSGTFWYLSTANLVDYLEGRELTPKCDFTSPVQRESVVIDASVEKVYDSLVDGEKVSQWWGMPVEIDPRVGGDWIMGEGHTVAKIIDVVPGRSMSIKWDDSVVSTWELEGSGGKTRLTFVHSGFDESDPPYAAWMGWLAGLAELRRFNELSDWRPIWSPA